MPDPTNIAIENSDDLNAVQKASFIERREHHKSVKAAEEQKAKDQKEAASKEEYSQEHGHEPIDPLSF